MGQRKRREGRWGSEPENVLHCWFDAPNGGSTCLLVDGHTGPHEFTSDDQIGVTFRDGPEEGYGQASEATV